MIASGRFNQVNPPSAWILADSNPLAMIAASRSSILRVFELLEAFLESHMSLLLAHSTVCDAITDFRILEASCTPYDCATLQTKQLPHAVWTHLEDA